MSEKPTHAITTNINVDYIGARDIGVRGGSIPTHKSKGYAVKHAHPLRSKQERHQQYREQRDSMIRWETRGDTCDTALATTPHEEAPCATIEPLDVP